MTMYYPEMQEQAPSGALVKTYHVINDTYSADWRPTNEARVLALFKALRIRPRRIESSILRDGSTKRWALITGAAHSKLCHRSDVAARVLLD